MLKTKAASYAGDQLCSIWHGQQRRQAVARRDSMAASTPNSHEIENKCEVKNRAKKIPPHAPNRESAAWIPSRALASPQSRLEKKTQICVALRTA